MTSRVSFPKLLTEITKNHLASLLITVLAFLIHLISFFMSVQNAMQTVWIEDSFIGSFATPDRSYILEEIMELCAPSFANVFVAMLIAAYLAFDYFRYLHSKKETDFFASLPVRRQEQFKTRFLSCFGIFAILCTITLGIELGIVFSTGYGSLAILQNMLWNLLCMLGAFLATWVTVALAMIMTGHSIIALLGVGVLFCYVPLILNNLIPTYANVFFDTYVYRPQKEIMTSYYFSPATLAYKLVVDYHREGWHISRHWNYMIGICLFAVVIGVIAYLLFLRRPAEAAGRAMAFEKVNFIIRFLLVIPLSLYLGLFLKEMTSFAEMPWLIFGVIFGAALLHGIIECIFHFDIRALFTKKRQLLLSIALSLAFVCIFWFDVFSYDEYLPEKEDVSCIQLEINMRGLSTYDDWGYEKDWIRGEYMEDALLLAKELIHPEVLTDEEMANYSSDSITFIYHMKNGTKQYRRYTYNLADVPESLDRLYATEEFKNDCNPMYTIDPNSIVSISASNGVTSTELPKLTEEERDKLIDTYLEELTALTFTQILEAPASIELTFEYAIEDAYGKSYAFNNYNFIYGNFTKTLALLEEYGIYPLQKTEGIQFMQLEIYDDEYWKENGGPTTITDQNILKQLQTHMLPSDFVFHSYGSQYKHCELQVMMEGKTKYLTISIHEEYLEPFLP